MSQTEILESVKTLKELQTLFDNNKNVEPYSLIIKEGKFDRVKLNQIAENNFKMKPAIYTKLASWELLHHIYRLIKTPSNPIQSDKLR